jgi:amino acid transporter
VIKLAILMIVVAAGVPTATPQRLDPATWSSPGAIVATGMLVFVAYGGFELISNASDDVVDPARTLPRAFAWSIGIVVVLYVTISAVVVASLTPTEITAAADFALAQTASASLGRAGFTMVALAAVLATFSAINATLYGTARLSFTLAVEGELPPEFERRPWEQPIGLHITAVLGVAIAVGLPLESIASLSSSIFLIVFGVVNAAAFRSGAATHVWRPVAAAGLVCCVASLVVLTARSLITDRAALFVLVALVATALLGEFIVLRQRRDGHRELVGR